MVLQMAPRKNNTPEQIEMAIEVVRKGKKFSGQLNDLGYPELSYTIKISEKTQTGCTMGQSTVLTKLEETILRKLITALSDRHIPVTKDNLLL